MSADGNTFALPSAPSLISGKDVLRNKRIVQTGGGDVFWTKDILFVQADGKNRYRMLRSSDLSDLARSSQAAANARQDIRVRQDLLWFVLEGAIAAP
jgi:hypothetical protein